MTDSSSLSMTMGEKCGIASPPDTSVSSTSCVDGHLIPLPSAALSSLADDFAMVDLYGSSLGKQSCDTAEEEVTSSSEILSSLWSSFPSSFEPEKINAFNLITDEDFHSLESALSTEEGLQILNQTAILKDLSSMYSLDESRLLTTDHSPVEPAALPESPYGLPPLTHGSSLFSAGSFVNSEYQPPGITLNENSVMTGTVSEGALSSDHIPSSEDILNAGHLPGRITDGIPQLYTPSAADLLYNDVLDVLSSGHSDGHLLFDDDDDDYDRTPITIDTDRIDDIFLPDLPPVIAEDGSQRCEELNLDEDELDLDESLLKSLSIIPPPGYSLNADHCNSQLDFVFIDDVKFSDGLDTELLVGNSSHIEELKDDIPMSRQLRRSTRIQENEQREMAERIRQENIQREQEALLVRCGERGHEEQERTKRKDSMCAITCAMLVGANSVDDNGDEQAESAAAEESDNSSNSSSSCCLQNTTAHKNSKSIPQNSNTISQDSRIISQISKSAPQKSKDIPQKRGICQKGKGKGKGRGKGGKASKYGRQTSKAFSAVSEESMSSDLNEKHDTVDILKEETLDEEEIKSTVTFVGKTFDRPEQHGSTEKLTPADKTVLDTTVGSNQSILCDQKLKATTKVKLGRLELETVVYKHTTDDGDDTPGKEPKQEPAQEELSFSRPQTAKRRKRKRTESITDEDAHAGNGASDGEESKNCDAEQKAIAANFDSVQEASRLASDVMRVEKQKPQIDDADTVVKKWNLGDDREAVERNRVKIKIIKAADRQLVVSRGDLKDVAYQPLDSDIDDDDCRKSAIRKETSRQQESIRPLSDAEKKKKKDKAGKTKHQLRNQHSVHEGDPKDTISRIEETSKKKKVPTATLR